MNVNVDQQSNMERCELFAFFAI